MNRDGRSDTLATSLACPIITLDRFQPRLFPSPSAIGFRTSDPAWRFLAFPDFRLREAGPGAEENLGILVVLTNEPGLAAENLSTLMAGKHHAFLPFDVLATRDFLTGESVCRPQSFAELIAECKRLSDEGQSSLGVPRSAACKTAKACRCGPVRLHREPFAASLAIFYNHV
jgi:hypothetical protein